MTDVEEGTFAARFTPRGNRVNEHSPLETIDARRQVVVATSHGVGLSPGRASDPRSKMTKHLAKGAEWGPGNARNVLAAVFLTKKECSGCVKMGDRNVAQDACLTTRGSVSHDAGWRVSRHGAACLMTGGGLSHNTPGGPGRRKQTRDRKKNLGFPAQKKPRMRMSLRRFFSDCCHTQHKTRRTWQRTRCDNGACECGEGHKGTQGRGDATGGNQDNGADNDGRFTQTQWGKECSIKQNE